MTPEYRQFQSVFTSAGATRLLRVKDILLLVLYNERGSGWYPKDVAQLTGIDSAHLSLAKEELVNLGFLTVHVPHRDQRRKKWYLTDAGQTQAASIWTGILGLAKMSPDWILREPEETLTKREQG